MPITTPVGITYQSGGDCPRCATGELAWVVGQTRLCLHCGHVVEPGEDPQPEDSAAGPAYPDSSAGSGRTSARTGEHGRPVQKALSWSRGSWFWPS